VHCSRRATFGRGQSSWAGNPLPKSRGALLPGGAGGGCRRFLTTVVRGLGEIGQRAHQGGDALILGSGGEGDSPAWVRVGDYSLKTMAGGARPDIRSGKPSDGS
jgi:hypothetical protein